MEKRERKPFRQRLIASMSEGLEAIREGRLNGVTLVVVKPDTATEPSTAKSDEL